jgi:hypothetical protein
MAYYHWKRPPVDFVYLDNSRDEGFRTEQLKWLSSVLEKDETDKDVLSVVVGMHRALPNSLACGHSMNGDPGTPADLNRRSLESGRTAYRSLLDFQHSTGKTVYVLASHSHFFMSGIFETPYWQNTGEKDRGVLEARRLGHWDRRRKALPSARQSSCRHSGGYVCIRISIRHRKWRRQGLF